MKTTSYLWIAPLLGILTIAGCSTTPTSPSTASTGSTQSADEPAAPPAATTQTATATGPLVTLVNNAPSLIGVGGQLTYELTATAQQEVAEVKIIQYLPDGATYVSSRPEAAREGNKLTWTIGNLGAGQNRSVSLTVKADREGDLVSCASVTAVPSLCITTVVGRPQLLLSASGPALARLGQDLAHTIVIRNGGRTDAKDVVVTNRLPEQLTSGNQRLVAFRVGDIPAGQSKTLTVPLTASARGKGVNEVVAVSSNTERVAAEVTTTVVKPEVAIQLNTQDVELFINRPATYAIEASNPGDLRLTDVVVTANAAPGTVIATAEGATVNGTTAVWRLAQLEQGEKKALSMRVISQTPGTFATGASVTSAEGMQAVAENKSTLWKGVTGFTLEMVDDPDPIQVGETSKFTVRVTNQGTQLSVSGLKIIATLPDELEVVPGTVSDQGVVEGKTITWPTVPNVGPRASVNYSYTVKGTKSGDARTKLSVTTSFRTNPLEQFESTTVY